MQRHFSIENFDIIVLVEDWLCVPNGLEFDFQRISFESSSGNILISNLIFLQIYLVSIGAQREKN